MNISPDDFKKFLDITRFFTNCGYKILSTDINNSNKSMITYFVPRDSMSIDTIFIDDKKKKINN